MITTGLHPKTSTNLKTFINKNLSNTRMLDCACGTRLPAKRNKFITNPTHQFRFNLRGNNYRQGLKITNQYLHSTIAGVGGSLVTQPLQNLECQCGTDDGKSLRFELDNSGHFAAETLELTHYHKDAMGNLYVHADDAKQTPLEYLPDIEYISDPEPSHFNVTHSEKSYFKNIKNNIQILPSGVDIPPDFMLGLSTAAYQIEGGSTEGGRGLSHWDTYLYSGVSNLATSGQFTAEFYYAWKDDIDRLSLMGIKAFRVSIAWSRIFPNGESTGRPNIHGINFYKNIITYLIQKKIKPVICLMHWDMPSGIIQKLISYNNTKSELVGLAYTNKDKYKDGKKLDDIFMDSWKYYVSNVYTEILQPYITKILYVSSINEISTIASNAYMMGQMAPGISVDRSQTDFGNWNSSYWALYNLIRMHAVSYHIYKDIFSKIKNAPPFTADNTILGLPLKIDPNGGGDRAAYKYYNRSIDWRVKIVFDPIIHGKWSKEMEKFFGLALTVNKWRGSFPPTEFEKGEFDPKNTCDIIAFHYYNSSVVKASNEGGLNNLLEGAIPTTSKEKQAFIDTNNIIYNLWDIDGQFSTPGTIIYKSPLGENTIPNSQAWTGFYPEGMGIAADLLHEIYPHIKDIYQTEAGTAEAVKERINIHDSVNDIVRVDWYSRSLTSLLTSTAAGAGVVKGCLFWAFQDNLEWMLGTSAPFGCYYCNYWGTGRYGIRNPKMSAGWLAACNHHGHIFTTKEIKSRPNLFKPDIDTRLTLHDEYTYKPLNTILLTNNLKTITPPVKEKTTYTDKNITYPLQQICVAAKAPGTIRNKQIRSCNGPVNGEFNYDGLPWPKKS